MQVYFYFYFILSPTVIGHVNTLAVPTVVSTATGTEGIVSVISFAAGSRMKTFSCLHRRKSFQIFSMRQNRYCRCSGLGRRNLAENKQEVDLQNEDEVELYDEGAEIDNEQFQAELNKLTDLEDLPWFSLSSFNPDNIDDSKIPIPNFTAAVVFIGSMAFTIYLYYVGITGLPLDM